MQIKLDRHNGKALYLQIVDAVRGRIEGGQLPPYTRLPSSRQLAQQLSVNRITVVNAYAELEAEGLVKSHVGRGTFVAEVPAPISGEKGAAPWRPPLQKLPHHSLTPNQIIREMMRTDRHPGVISFALGSPASDFIPVVEFRQALNEVLRRDGVEALQYGDSIGYFPLRQTIATYLSGQGVDVAADDILITDGCQQALDLVLRVLGRDGDAVLVENPSYLGLLDIITSHHMTPIGVPTDEAGLQVENLEPLILRYHPQLLYLVPNFQNPTGATMPLERRQQLLEIAHRYNLPILEDNIYHELYHHTPPPGPLIGLDHGPGSLVFHASSYSKILIPGLRLGYLVAPSAMQEQVISLKQALDISTASLNQRALDVYLHSGHFDRHLDQTRRAYVTRRGVMLAAAERYFPDTASWQTPQGGLYLWVQMDPAGPRAADLYLKAIDYGVAFGIGSVFFAHNPSHHTMRLNYAAQKPEAIEEGMRRLGKAWQELLVQRPEVRTRTRQPAMPIL
jgi:DNA-binding transcriptional MocR family regulator